MNFGRAAAVVWKDWPAGVQKVAPRLAVAMRDGDYLCRFPGIAVAVPAAALAIGVVGGATQAHEVFSYSVVRLAAFAFIGSLGAGPGLAMWVGFAFTDFVWVDRSRFFSVSGFDGRLRLYGSLLVADMLLGWLLVLVPIAVGGVRTRVVRALGSSPMLRVAGGAAVAVGMQWGCTYLWAHATAFLIRPIWTFHGRNPSVPGIQPLQGHAWVLAIVATLGAIVRLAMTRSERAVPGIRVSVPASGATRVPKGQASSLSSVLAVIGKTLLLTLLVSGLLSSWAQALEVAIFLGTVLGLQTILFARVPAVPEAILRVPMPLRAISGPVVAYLVGNAVVERAVHSGESSFQSMVVTLLIGISVSAFVMPRRALESS